MGSNELDRAAIRARAEAVTGGEWHASGGVVWTEDYDHDDPTGEATVQVVIAQATQAGAEFIAHARKDVSALLDALDAAEARAERAEQVNANALSLAREGLASDGRNDGWHALQRIINALLPAATDEAGTEQEAQVGPLSLDRRLAKVSIIAGDLATALEVDAGMDREYLADALERIRSAVRGEHCNAGRATEGGGQG